MVDDIGHLIEAKIVERAVQTGKGLDHFTDDPAIDRQACGGRID